LPHIQPLKTKTGLPAGATERQRPVKPAGW